MNNEQKMIGALNRTARRRFLAVDALKGLAMVLVILQHSYLSVNMQTISWVIDILIWNITSLAAVAFVAISGVLYSHFIYAQTHWGIAYLRYYVRAAFLILAAHPAINLMSYYFRIVGNEGSMSDAPFLTKLLLDFPITDTIAACMLVAPAAIICLHPWLRAATIVIMLVMSVLIKAFVIPLDPPWVILKEAAFGGLELPKMFWFPFVPWFAIFLTGSFAGQMLAHWKNGMVRVATIIEQTYKTGFMLIGSGIILTTVYKFLKVVFKDAWSSNLFLALYPGQTTTLLPCYLGFLVLAFAILTQRIDYLGHYDRITWCLSIFGRTSLFTYVVQFVVVESAPALLGLKGTLGLGGFFVLFFSGVIIMWILSYSYGRLRGWFQESDYGRQVAFVEHMAEVKP